MYYLFIVFATVIISLINIFFVAEAKGFTKLNVAVFVVLSVLLVIVVDGIVAFIVRWLLPKKWFSLINEKKGASKKERLLLEKLGIKKWKDKIPELGSFAGFRKNKLVDPKNNEYVFRFIAEINYGIAVHRLSIIFGFLIIFMFPLSLWLSVGLPIGIINGFYNLLSLEILKYNLPKLIVLYKFNNKKKAD